MDLYKSSLIKSILEKVGSSLSLPVDDFILTDLSDLMKKCHYLKIRSISNEFLNESILTPDKLNDILDAFRTQLSENSNNSFLKCHKSENNSNNNDDNISLSSDDLESENSEPSIKCRRRNSQKYAIDSDSDIEIIDDIVNEDSGNSRKRRCNNSKENIDIHKHPRYEFRERKNGNKTVDPTNASKCKLPRSVPVFYAAEESEVIQIEDSSDEDVQEIKRETNGSFNRNRRNAKPYKPTNIPNSATDHPPTQADPSQLASIPLIVQFPTMQSATFNGHLYISHNHKFSVKLQGVDPRNFRWN